MPAERGNERVDVRFGRFGREAHAQHARGGPFVELHRGVDMAELAAVAGRAGGDADALRAELGDDVRARIADERTDQARQLLEFAVSCHVDNSSIYTQLAAIYQTGGNLSGILQLQEAAAQLAPFPQKIILEKLKSFQP